ncbi:hypothetical protein AVEN_32393-1 [Araneus ventricosus]|uniref:Gustatory receptor n=1 Tax=Araneus ventricosus TaxID=182803 RepID=A0A4Y2QHP7_ARAVE|nr:hypothetical protein AVEN_32393-1 [Araneus ventricosus]
MSILTWYALRRYKQMFTTLMSSLNNSHPFKLTKFETCFLFLICSTPIIHTTMKGISVFFSHGGENTIYGVEVNLNLKGTVSILKHMVTYLVYPTWANLLVLIYCLLCKTLCRSLSNLSTAIEKCSPQQFTLSRQTDIIKQELEINRVVRYLQAIFSVPSLLLSLAHFGVCISALGTSFNVPALKMGWYFVIKFSLTLANSFIGLVTFLWMAGGLPVEAAKFKEAFRRKISQRVTFLRKEEEIHFEKYLPDVSSYVLSGWDIIYFQRSSILAVAGTLLTYTILLIN